MWCSQFMSFGNNVQFIDCSSYPVLDAHCIKWIFMLLLMCRSRVLCFASALIFKDYLAFSTHPALNTPWSTNLSCCFNYLQLLSSGECRCQVLFLPSQPLAFLSELLQEHWFLLCKASFRTHHHTASSRFQSDDSFTSGFHSRMSRRG